jgi:hypothetical protein
MVPHQQLDGFMAKGSSTGQPAARCCRHMLLLLLVVLQRLWLQLCRLLLLLLHQGL